jgi:hypothetical protein
LAGATSSSNYVFVHNRNSLFAGCHVNTSGSEASIPKADLLDLEGRYSFPDATLEFDSDCLSSASQRFLTNGFAD